MAQDADTNAAKGLGPQTMHEVYSQVVTWAQSGELIFDMVKVPLSDIETAWQRSDLRAISGGG
jgi:hypothetical protein